MGIAFQSLFDAGIRLEVNGSKLRVIGPRALTDEERHFIRSNKPGLIETLSQRQTLPDASNSETALGRPLAAAQTWRFLFGCPFTRKMLRVAATRWGAPLDEQELQHIAQGYYRFEQREQALRQHLCQWAENHPVCMAELTAPTGRDSHGIWAAIAPLDHHGKLIAFPGDPRAQFDDATGQFIGD